MAERQNLSELGKRLNEAASAPLLRLIDPTVDYDRYRLAMKELGGLLGSAFVEQQDVSDTNVLIATTVEDADYLSTGFAEVLEQNGAEVSLACLWMDRSVLPLDEDADVAQIRAEFIEPLPDKIHHFVALKSIIATSCVIRSTMLRLLDQSNPSQIHVVAPVSLAGAQERLRAGFPEWVANSFRFWVLAEDAIQLEDGNVFPGVGGNVYNRLGLGDQDDKNRHMPEMVLRRIARRKSTHQPRFA